LQSDDDNFNIGSVLSPHDVHLMKVVEWWKKEGISLLLLRYSTYELQPGEIVVFL
jgi:hypothetical protein